MTDFEEQFAKEFGVTNEEAMDEIKENSSRALDFKKVYNNRVADRFERLIAQQKESSSDDEELLAHADVRARKNYFRGSPAEREEAKRASSKASSKVNAEEAKRLKALSKANAAEEAKRAKAEAAEEAKRLKAEAAEEAKRAKAEAAEEAKRAKAEAAEEAKRAKAEAAEEAKRAKQEAAEEAKRAKQEAAEEAKASKAKASKGGARKRAKTAGEQEAEVHVSSSTPRSKVIVFDYPIMCDIPRETLYYLQIALYFLIHQPNRLEACTEELVEKVLSKKYLLQIICRMRDVALGHGMKDVPEIDEYIASICKSSPKYPVIPMNDMSSYTKFAYWAMVTSGPLVQRFMLDKTPEEIAEHVRNPVNNVQNGFGFYDELVSMNGDDSQRLRGNSVFEDSSENDDEFGTLSKSVSLRVAASDSASRVKEPICYMGTTPFDPRRELMEENFVSTRPSSRSATPVPLVAAQKHLVVYCEDEEEDEDDEDEDIWVKAPAVVDGLTVEHNSKAPVVNEGSKVEAPVVNEGSKVDDDSTVAAAEEMMSVQMPLRSEGALIMDVEKPVAVSKICTTTAKQCPSTSVSAFEMELVNQLKVYNENVAGIISLLRQKRSIGDLF
jgi:hypothetical protein